jgi:hypothetical protein
MITALHFRTARDILGKARRERTRYAAALDRDDREAAADHLFNLAVTILAVRDWVEKTTSSEHAKAAHTLVNREPAVARLFDAANISKHGGVLDRPPRSKVEIISQSFTAVPQRSLAPWDAFPGGEVAEEVRSTEVASDPPAMQTMSKATLADRTRHFHLDDADAAIAAWKKFLEEKGL